MLTNLVKSHLKKKIWEKNLSEVKLWVVNRWGHCEIPLCLWAMEDETCEEYIRPIILHIMFNHLWKRLYIFLLSFIKSKKAKQKAGPVIEKLKLIPVKTLIVLSSQTVKGNFCPITDKHVYVFQCIIKTGAFHPGRMNSSIPELKTTHSKQQYIERDDSSSKDCGSVDRNVHPSPAGTAFWQGPPSDASIPEIVPHPHQHTIQPGMVDPLSLRCS